MTNLIGESQAILDLDYNNHDALLLASIVPATSLATDYLNVFNEAIMLFGLLADMPDIIDELSAWEPLTYEQHFLRSSFQGRDLAIIAYKNADPKIKIPFDALSRDTCHFIQRSIVQAKDMMAARSDMTLFVVETTESLQTAIMKLDSMVHGGQIGGAQSDVDSMFDNVPDEPNI